ncbi:MAG TPA: hypothetical protein EYQ27_00170 [Gemmatimonadetes bacterium]|nr:hypothetical protein [Gemmatimonadota bacterium]
MKCSRMVPALAVGCLLFVGCEVPTGLPELEQRWIVPVEEIILSVDELLPDGVSISGSNFSVAIDPFASNETLLTFCGNCVALNGFTVPAPAFTGSFSVSENLPANVTAAQIASGTIQIVITNGLSFDPIAGGGTFTVTLSDGDGGAQLGQVVVDGATESMPGNSSRTETLSIGSASIGTTFFASVSVVSVGGQVTTIDITDEITVTATTTSLLVSSATVTVASQSVDFDPVELDLGDIDSDITDHIQSGTLILDVVNPFGVSVDGTLNIGPTAKSFSIASGSTSSTSINYTSSELQSFLGQDNITFSGSGTASGGSVTVSPGQEMLIEATLDMTIRIGG